MEGDIINKRKKFRTKQTVSQTTPIKLNSTRRLYVMAYYIICS